MSALPGVRTSGEVRAASGATRRYFALAALALVGIGIAQVALFLLQGHARSTAERSRTATALTRRAYTLATDRSWGVRGVVLAHDSMSGAVELAARQELPAVFDSLMRVTAEDSLQRQRVQAVQGALAAWDSAYSRPALLNSRAGASETARGAALFETVRHRFDELLAAQVSSDAARVPRDDLIGLLALFGLVVPLVVLAGVFDAMGRRVARQTDTLMTQQEQLATQAGTLERQVEALERTNRELSGAVIAAAQAQQQTRAVSAERERATALLDAALLSAPFGFAFVDRDTRIVRTNTVLASFAQRSPAAAVGSRLEDVLLPELGGPVVARVGQVLETGTPVINLRVRIERSAGIDAPRDLVVDLYPVKAPTAEIIGVGAVFTDVSERIRLEAQALRSQKMEAVGQLAGGVAHDFNNLLTVIRSYCDLVLLEMAADNPSRTEMVEIRDAADRAAELARQLLAFSRKQVILPRVVDVNAIVRAFEAMLRRTIPANVVLVLELESDVGAITADPGHIEQLLMNLAINSADAMPRGGRLVISTRGVTLDESEAQQHGGLHAGAYVSLAVSDTGTGIPPEVMQHVFEPFFTTKPLGKGTGLGLSSVYGIVHQNGGHVEASSESGEGTTFTMYFPRALEAVSAPEPAPKRRVASRKNRETILVVEDEPAVRTTLTRILEREGYAILVAGHGGEAMRIADGHTGSIDLVISDLMMPEMSGDEFIERFSATRPRTRVLFMSGYTGDEVSPAVPGQARHAFIQKPFTVEQITKKVRDVLGSK